MTFIFLQNATGNKMISFNEIIGGADSSVRVTEDGLLYAVDLVMVITAKNKNDSARVIKDLTNDIFQQVMYYLLIAPIKKYFLLIALIKKYFLLIAYI